MLVGLPSTVNTGMLCCLYLRGRFGGQAEPGDSVVVKRVSPGSALPRISGLPSAQQYLGLPRVGDVWLFFFLCSWVLFSAAPLAVKAFALVSALGGAGASHSQPSFFAFAAVFLKRFRLHFRRKKKKCVLGLPWWRSG